MHHHDHSPRPFRINRRALLQGAAALAAGLALPAGKAFAQDTADPASLKRAGGTLLNFRAWERYPASDVPGLNLFLDQNPDLSIEWSSAPFGRYRDRLIAEFIGGTPLDVIQVPETELASWAESEWLMALDDMENVDKVLAAASPGNVEASRGPDGKLYGLPVFADAFGFAYNTDAFAAAGFEKPGATLDELRVQMEAIKAAGVDPYPLSLGMKKQPGQFWSLWSTLYASGGDMFDEAGQPLFDKPDSPFKPILEWYVAAYNDWKIVSLEDLQRDWGAARTGIRSNQIKSGYMAQYALTEFNAKPDSAVTGKIKMALVPGLNGNDVGTVGYCHGAGIAATTKNKDAAWKALYAYAGPGADDTWTLTEMRALDQGGRCPFPQVYDSAELQALIQTVTVGDSADWVKLSTLSRPKRGIKAAWYPEWEQGFMTHVQDALLKSTTVDAAIASSADLARQLSAG